MAPPHSRALGLAAGLAGLIAGLGLGLRLGGGNSRESANSSRAWARAVAGASAGSAQPSTASAPALLHPQLAEFAACNLQEVKSGYSKGFQVRKQVVVRSTVARYQQSDGPVGVNHDEGLCSPHGTHRVS